MKIQELTKKFFQVDAFTTEPYKGNPAGIYFPEKELLPAEMQAMAAEFNLPETAFILLKDGDFEIHFYTPYDEIPLCGHAALAAAHILYEKNIVPKKDSITFKSSRYQIELRYINGSIQIELPAYKIKQIPITAEFVEVTGLTPNELYRSSHDWTIAVFDDADDIIRAKPYYSKMKHSDFGHLIITASGKEHECDYLLRCFAPAFGINEDPVTGSAHCALVPIWKEKMEQSEFTTIQLSKRGGKLISSYLDENKITVKGNAYTILEGTINL